MIYREFLSKYGQLEIDEYLHLIGDKLQISKNQRESIQKNYEALVDYIENNNSLTKTYDKIIAYAQGSYAIDTVNKPLRNDEFDIDIIVEFPLKVAVQGPKVFYDELLNVFSGESRYADIVEPKNRCVRINYKSSNYYFDILPVVPTNQEGIKHAPDKKLEKWVRTSPKRYRDWFNKKAAALLLEYRELEPLQTDELPFQMKPPLKRAVQLVKRSRDIFFKDEEKYYTSSIIITTLFGKHYNSEKSPFLCIKNVVSILKQKYTTTFELKNPVDNNESFTEKWVTDIKYYSNFKSFIDFLYKKINEIENSQGINNKLLYLSELFGDSTVDSVVSTYSEWNNRKNYSVDNKGKLSTSNNINTAKKNTFYGE
ncbi:MAG: nucleotidyltransferase [Tenericutes bacterium]|nr:nucleotidyltransferase [Mycoplasmatota bacterium]